MSASIPCPKCNSYSWIDVEDGLPVQKCVCGYRLYLEVHSDGIITTHKPQNIDKVALPAKGSQLSKILGCLVVMGDLSSAGIAEVLKVPINKVTTNLSVLRSRGLVTVINNRRGYTGGSLWKVHEEVKIKYRK